MRMLVLAGMVAVLLVAGCLSPLGVPSEQQGQPSSKVCRNVTVQKPVVREECSQVQSTAEVCGLKKLAYTVSQPPKADLCIIDGNCVGQPLSQCPACTVAMTRCTLTITNGDPQKSGTWRVGANFTLANAGFDKGPITLTIKPNESGIFDFQQIYGAGDPVNSAMCNVFILDEAVVEDCHQETRPGTECRNVTNMTPVTTQVCN